MIKRRILAAALMAIVVIVLAMTTTGCERVPLSESRSSNRGAGAASSETTAAALGSARRMDARIRMGVGSLKMSSVPSSTAAFDARFTFTLESRRPQVAYAVDSTDGTPTARLSVDQPEVGNPIPLGEVENEWEVDLANGVPTDLSLELGVGEARIDLSGVDVRSIEAITGVGETVIDVSGPRANDMSGTITSGVGELTVRLPRDVGVQVTGGGDGLGNVSSKGFKGSGTVLTNEAWSGPGPKISLKIVRGVGDVTLELVD